MSYWKGLVVAVAFDIAWIMANPLAVTGPEPGKSMQAGVAYMQEQPEVPEDPVLDEAGRLEDSLMTYLQGHEDDVDAMENLARLYVEHGWYDAAIGPLARAAQLEPERYEVWSLLNRAVKGVGKAQITDGELIERAAQFVEAVQYWGDQC